MAQNLSVSYLKSLGAVSINKALPKRYFPGYESPPVYSFTLPDSKKEEFRKRIESDGFGMRRYVGVGYDYNNKGVVYVIYNQKQKTMATKKKKSATPKQKVAREKFKTNAKKANALVKSGKAKNLKSAWKQIKK